MTLYTLENECWQVGILPETGAAIAFGRVRVGDSWRDVLRPTAEADFEKVSLCSSFLMLPWANRIKDARFHFRGHDYQLQATTAEGMAIHGVTRGLPWQVEKASKSRVEMTFDSADFSDLNFPFQFSARQEVSIEGCDLNVAVTLTNADAKAFPAGFGHHPYFVRDAANAVQIEIPCDQRFVLEKLVAVDPPTDLTPETDFRQRRLLGTRYYEELYTARQSQMLAARVFYPELTVALLADPLFEQVMFFAPEGKPFFAIEPQSNANDGFNLYDRGVAGNGVFVLEPGESKSGMIRFQVEEA